MNKLFYLKLAFLNIKSNRKIYVPYILSSIFVIMMFYIMSSITSSPITKNSVGSNELVVMLRYGEIIVGMFSVVLIIYVNNFISKKRYKEFGLYNILGLDKKHIGLILFFETLIVALISLFTGNILGVIFSKISELILSSILVISPQAGFYISFSSLIVSVVIFSVSFFLTFMMSLRKIHLAKPIELLNVNNMGEKEPKVKKIKLVIGLLSLISGYAMAVLIDDPTIAFVMFFVAVILVIIGTYFLFETGTIFILKMMKKNKKFYYDKNNFTMISGMLFRMKQNAAGLATICIFSTCMLVAISTTVALYVGIEQGVNETNPHDVIINNYQPENNENYDEAIAKVLKDNAINPTSYIDYDYFQFWSTKHENKFGETTVDTENEIVRICGYTIETYNQQMKTNYTLEDNEILFLSNLNEQYDNVILGDSTYVVKENITTAFDYDRLLRGYSNGAYLIVVSDEIQMLNVCNQLNELGIEKIENKIYLNTDASETQINQLVMDTRELKFDGVAFNLKIDELKSRYSLYGSMFFVGIFVGILFLMATVLIIYYKQVQEGYDDAQRFIIMQKVGMSKNEVKKTINKQVLTVFFLPIIVAIVHILFSYKMIYLILTMLNAAGEQVFMISIGVSITLFIVIYSIVYYVTSKIYYDIVSFK